MTDDEIEQQKTVAVNRTKAILQENFDAGVILVCHDMSDGRTGRVFNCFGNFYTWVGLCNQFLRTRDDQ